MDCLLVDESQKKLCILFHLISHLFNGFKCFQPFFDNNPALLEKATLNTVYNDLGKMMHLHWQIIHITLKHNFVLERVTPVFVAYRVSNMLTHLCSN